MRQQRATKSQRALSRSNPARPEDIQWRLKSNAGNSIFLTLLGAPTDLILAGIPAVRRLLDNLPPIAANLVGDELELVYTSPNGSSWGVDISTGLKELRTPWGGFLAAGNISSLYNPPNPSPPTTSPWVVQNPVGATVEITTPGGTTIIRTAGTPQFRNDRLNDVPVSATSGAATIVLTYPAAVASGDILSLGQLDIGAWLEDPSIFEAGSQAIP